MGWVRAAQERRLEEEMWEHARHDHRIMDELRHAVMRSRNGV
jgi:predicted small metal-binding protein